MKPSDSQEEERLQSLERCSCLKDCDPEPFEEAIHLLAEVCEVPLALVSIVEREETRFVSERGIGITSISRPHSFCHHALCDGFEDGFYIVKDSHDHPELSKSPLVTTSPKIRSYVGVPLYFSNGHIAGMLAGMDLEPREFDSSHRAMIARLAKMLTHELRRVYESGSGSRMALLPHQSSGQIQRPENQLQLYEAIFRHTSEAVAVIGPDGEYIAQNPAHRSLIGYDEKELINRTPSIHLGDEVFQEIAEELGRSGRYSGQVESTAADGERLQVNLNAFTLHDSRGNVLCHVGLKRDITDQKRTETALADSIERFELSVKGSRDGLWDAKIYTMDPASNRNMVYAAPRCRELLGYVLQEAELTVPSVFAQVHADDRALVIRRIREHLIKGNTFEVDLRMRTKCGGFRWFNARGLASGRPGKHPWPIRLAGSLRDITDQKQLEEDLLDTKMALESRVDERTGELRDANDELRREIDERRRAETVQRLLYQISEAASNTSSLTELCRSIHDSLGSVVDATNFYIGFYQPELKTITIPYQTDERDTDTNVTPEEFAESFTAMVIETNEPLLLNEAQMREATDRGDVGVVGTPCKAWLGVPLRTKNRLIGAVVVQSYTNPVAYSEDDVAMMSFIATQIANVLERRQAQEELHRTQQQLSLHFQQTPLAVILADLEGNVLEWNPSAEKFFGYQRDQAMGRPLLELIVPSGREERWEDFWRQILHAPEGFHGKFRNRTLDGQSIYCEWYNNPLIDEGDNVIAIASLVQDITDRVRAEEMLRVSEERYALAVRGANDGIWDWNLRDNHVYFSPRWKEMLGLEHELVTNTPSEWFTRVHEEDLPKLEEAIDKHLSNQTPHFECEYRMRHSDGELRWMLARGIAVQGDAKKPQRMAGSQTDITDWKRAQDQIVHAATHDSLTGLPNRALFMDRLRQSIHRLKRRPDFKFALLFLDLDRFKIINDSLGHVVGDQLLKQVASRLRYVLRPQDTIARFGGDEFTVLLDEIQGVDDAKRVADRLLEQFQDSYQVGDNELYVSASIGIVLSPEDAEEPEDLLRSADMAMYQAKGQGKASHLVFDQEMQEQAMESLRLENDMRRGLERNEFTVHWQPIVRLIDGTIAGVESLIRWKHPERGMLTPKNFLRVAEDTGLINRISHQTIRETIEEFAHWRSEWPSLNLSVGINVSAAQLLHGELEKLLPTLVAEFEIEPSAVILEIAEAIITNTNEQVIAPLERLRERGYRVCLDDFGSGFSSLKHLEHHIFDAIKLHPSFYKRKTRAGENEEILSTILHLVEHLGMTIIAENVDEAASMQLVRELPCQYVQGYEYSGVVSAAEIDTLFNNGINIRT